MRVVPGPDTDLSPFPASAWPSHKFSYPYDRATGKYFAHARLYDAETGRMLGRDPIRRGINPYPYCDNDPVNYTDPTGEIANILGGALTGGVIGGVFGFAGSAVSQLMSGKGIDMRRALGAGVNGAVVGAVRGAVIASGAGAFAGAGADFAAGMIGSALEQNIAGEEFDFGRTVVSGLSNAASGLAYGTGRIGSAREAFGRGFKSGAARSGIEYLYETLGKPKKKNRRKSKSLRNRTRRTIAPQLYGISDPRRNCTVQRSSTQKQLPGNGIVNKGLYEAAEDKLRTTEGFSLGGFVKAVALGGVMEGLGSAAFYGVGKGLESLWRSVKGYRPLTLKLGYDGTIEYAMECVGPSTEETFNVFGHGNKDYIKFEEKLLNADQVAYLIKKSPRYIGGNQIVTLYSCETGKEANGFAQQLANNLGTVVKAPNKLLYTTKSGDFVITDEVYKTGEWMYFFPKN